MQTEEQLTMADAWHGYFCACFDGEKQKEVESDSVLLKRLIGEKR